MTVPENLNLDDLRKKAEAATKGEWRYRPDDRFDDWGTVRGEPDEEGNAWFIAHVRAGRYVTAAEEAAHRHDKTDPFEANAAYIVAAQPQVVIGLIDELDAARKRIAELEEDVAKANRRATDQSYMLAAYWQMLGPKGLEVANMWNAKGVTRVHHSWGPDAVSMSGEERAQVILDFEAAPKTLIEDVDGHLFTTLNGGKQP